MTLEEAIKHAEEVAEEKENEVQDLEYSKLDWKHEADQCSKCAEEHRQLAEWLKDYKRLIEQEPCEKVAQERYADLCEYFGGAKDILKNRKDFKAWLGRVKWHIHKAEELYEKYEYKKEPCEDAINRQAVLNKILKFSVTDGKSVSVAGLWTEVNKLPPVKPQEPKTVLYSGDGYADGYMVYDMAECPNCGYEYEDGDKDWGLSFCPSCGQKLNWESEDKEGAVKHG